MFDYQLSKFLLKLLMCSKYQQVVYICKKKIALSNIFDMIESETLPFEHDEMQSEKKYGEKGWEIANICWNLVISNETCSKFHTEHKNFPLKMLKSIFFSIADPVPALIRVSSSPLRTLWPPFYVVTTIRWKSSWPQWHRTMQQPCTFVDPQ